MILVKQRVNMVMFEFWHSKQTNLWQKPNVSGDRDFDWRPFNKCSLLKQISRINFNREPPYTPDSVLCCFVLNWGVEYGDKLDTGVQFAPQTETGLRPPQLCCSGSFRAKNSSLCAGYFVFAGLKALLVKAMTLLPAVSRREGWILIRAV